jgi:hypothetical protein
MTEAGSMTSKASLLEANTAPRKAEFRSEDLCGNAHCILPRRTHVRWRNDEPNCIRIATRIAHHSE